MWNKACLTDKTRKITLRIIKIYLTTRGIYKNAHYGALKAYPRYKKSLPKELKPVRKAYLERDGKSLLEKDRKKERKE